MRAWPLGVSLPFAHHMEMGMFREVRCGGMMRMKFESHTCSTVADLFTSQLSIAAGSRLCRSPRRAT